MPERLAAVHRLESLDRSLNLLAPAQRAGARRVRQHKNELLASETTGHVASPNRAFQERRDFDEHEIARLVAERIVDALEVIEIHHDGREPGARAPGADQLAPQELAQEAPVVETGHRIAYRLLGELAQRVLQRLVHATPLPDDRGQYQS